MILLNNFKNMGPEMQAFVPDSEENISKQKALENIRPNSQYEKQVGDVKEKTSERLKGLGVVNYNNDTIKRENNALDEKTSNIKEVKDIYNEKGVEGLIKYFVKTSFVSNYDRFKNMNDDDLSVLIKDSVKSLQDDSDYITSGIDSLSEFKRDSFNKIMNFISSLEKTGFFEKDMAYRASLLVSLSNVMTNLIHKDVVEGYLDLDENNQEVNTEKSQKITSVDSSIKTDRLEREIKNYVVENIDYKDLEQGDQELIDHYKGEFGDYKIFKHGDEVLIDSNEYIGVIIKNSKSGREYMMSVANLAAKSFGTYKGEFITGERSGLVEGENGNLLMLYDKGSEYFKQNK